MYLPSISLNRSIHSYLTNLLVSAGDDRASKIFEGREMSVALAGNLHKRVQKIF